MTLVSLRCVTENSRVPKERTFSQHLRIGLHLPTSGKAEKPNFHKQHLAYPKESHNDKLLFSHFSIFSFSWLNHSHPPHTYSSFKSASEQIQMELSSFPYYPWLLNKICPYCGNYHPAVFIYGNPLPTRPGTTLQGGLVGVGRQQAVWKVSPRQ